MESVEICKKEIYESLGTLDWVADKTTSNDKFIIYNAIEIIRVFTDILIEHTKKGDKDGQKSSVETVG